MKTTDLKVGELYRDTSGITLIIQSDGFANFETFEMPRGEHCSYFSESPGRLSPISK